MRVRAQATEVCRLCYVCVFAAAVTAHSIAQELLLQSYRCAGRRRLDEDELILPLAQRFCGVPEWARCSTTCRTLHRLGWPSSEPCSWRIATLWLAGFSPEGQKEALRLAIQHNAKGLLPLLGAAGANMNCVFEQSLLALGARVTERDSHGAAPIHLVASKGRLPIVDLLFQHDPSCARAVDYCGRTPCHMGALKGHLAVVRWLVDMRGDPFAVTSDGRTPLDMAHRGQHAEVVEFLESLQRRQAEDVPAARILLVSLFRRRRRVQGVFPPRSHNLRQRKPLDLVLRAVVAAALPDGS